MTHGLFHDDTDEIERAFWVGFYEGVTCDADTESDCAGNDALERDLRAQFRAFKRGEWVIPFDR